MSDYLINPRATSTCGRDNDHTDTLSLSSYDHVNSTSGASDSERSIQSLHASDSEDSDFEAPKGGGHSQSDMPQPASLEEPLAAYPDTEVLEEVNFATTAQPYMPDSVRGLEIRKKDTMIRNAVNYISQILLYLNMLRALHSAGHDDVKRNIRNGIHGIVTQHSNLFYHELQSLAGHLLDDLAQTIESLELYNRNLKQDNNSLKTLREVEAERRVNAHEKELSTLLAVTKQQSIRLSNRDAEIEETKAKNSKLSQEVSVLKSENHELERKLSRTEASLFRCHDKSTPHDAQLSKGKEGELREAASILRANELQGKDCEKIASELMELAPKVEELQRKNREMAEKVQDRYVAVTQLHSCRTENARLQQKAWKLEEERDRALKQVQKNTEIGQGIKYLESESKLIRERLEQIVAATKHNHNGETGRTARECQRFPKKARV